MESQKMEPTSRLSAALESLQEKYSLVGHTIIALRISPSLPMTANDINNMSKIISTACFEGRNAALQKQSEETVSWRWSDDEDAAFFMFWDQSEVLDIVTTFENRILNGKDNFSFFDEMVKHLPDGLKFPESVSLVYSWIINADFNHFSLLQDLFYSELVQSVLAKEETGRNNINFDGYIGDGLFVNLSARSNIAPSEVIEQTFSDDSLKLEVKFSHRKEDTVPGMPLISLLEERKKIENFISEKALPNFVEPIFAGIDTNFDIGDE